MGSWTEPPGADSDWVRRIRKGEVQAYGELVGKYQNRLRSILAFYCSSSGEVEEHLQEAFVQAYTHLGQFDLSAPFFPWLRAIALNGLRDRIRDRETAKKRASEYLVHLQMSQIQADPDGTHAESRSAALNECLEKLPKAHVDLLRARFQEQRSLDEIAARFNLSKGALKVRLLRLRQTLKGCIEKHAGTLQVG